MPNSPLTDALNAAIQSDPHKGVFYGGQGVVIRNMDDELINAGQCRVVPGTFWHNDIWPPNQIYPAKTDIKEGDVNGTNWVTPTLAVAIGPEHFNNCLFNSSDLHDEKWIDGVWYAHDSNSCDLRARYVPEHHGYDAPYAWIDTRDGTSTRNSQKVGSGGYDSGNPTLPKPLGGGGTGVHVWHNWDGMRDHKSYDQGFNQIDGKKANPSRPLVADHTCQIDYHSWNDKTRTVHYDAVDGWRDWIRALAADAKARKIPGEAWLVDLGIGWVNNPRPMITLQNALWKYRADWCTGNSEPPDPNSPKHYWGWNEIPFSKKTINNPDNWSTFIIVLPPGVQHLSDSLKNSTAMDGLISQLEAYESRFHLIPNKSSMVLARQVINTHAENQPAGLVWMRQFFTEEVAIGKWHIKNGIICK